MYINILTLILNKNYKKKKKRIEKILNLNLIFNYNI